MKNHIKTLVLTLSVLGAGSAFAVDPKRVGDCADYAESYQATAAARERFGRLQGACEGIYDIDGALYAHAEMVVRGNRGGVVTLYLPATDKTIEVTPQANQRVIVDGRKVRVRDLNRGDEIGIYVSMDKFFEEKLTEVAFAAPDEAPEQIHIAPVQEVAALPTTASVLPAIALFSGLLFAAGLFMRRFQRTV